MATSESAIASRGLLARDVRGTEFTIMIGVGVPHQNPDNWACPVTIQGLGFSRDMRDIFGLDSWQALTLAYQFIGQILANFIEDGGQLYSLEERLPVSVEELLPKLTLPLNKTGRAEREQ